MKAVRFASQSLGGYKLWRLFVPLCLGAAVLGSGCGSSRPDSIAGSAGPGGPKGTPAGPCEDGERRDCGITLDQHNGVVTCFHGTQTCEGAEWGECTDGVIQEMASPGLKTLALSDAEECTDNPCDPYCQQYSEDPDQPVEPQEDDDPWQWDTGSLATFPGGLVDKGFVEPCETAMDCQFNMRCEAPALDNCPHSVCVTGDAMEDSCNSCAALVCDQDASCCDTTPTTVDSCNHDPCALGEGLDSSCNTCVEDICDTPGLEDCCDTSGSNSNWTQDCVDAVASVCGNTCGCAADAVEDNGSCYYLEETHVDWIDARDDCEDRGAGWALVTIDDNDENGFVADLAGGEPVFIGMEDDFEEWTWVGDPDLGIYNEDYDTSNPVDFYVNWESGFPDNGDDSECGYMNATGTWETEGTCNSNTSTDQRASVCEGPLDTMQEVGGPGGEWTADCTALAESVCDVFCDADDPSNSEGSCVPWYPGETDPTCSGVDLAIGVPCDGVIPVCNHGNSTATGPIEVMHWAANSQQFPTCSPDTSHPSTVTCTLNEDVPPGECRAIDADNCLDLDGDPAPLTGNREIMVNTNGDVEECTCLDNWSLFAEDASACTPPSCSGNTSAATQAILPIDIIVIVDNSPSMVEEIGEIEARIYTDLAEILEDSGIDYRVILISRFGDKTVAEGPSSVPICIPAPLGSNACTDASNETLANNSPNFFHHSTDIESWDSWCQLLEGFDTADEVGITDAMWNGVAGTGRTWTALNPDGWQSRLREDAFKHFVIISDDDIDCDDYGYDFDDTPDCDGFPHHCHDMANSEAYDEQMAAAPDEALEFDTTLLAMSPEQFGTASNRRYMWHSITNIAPNSAGDTVPYEATEPLEKGMCTDPYALVVGAGTAYQSLSILTGGLRYPICEYQDYDAIFNAIADSAIETTAPDCAYAMSTTDEYNPDNAYVSWIDSDSVSTTLTQVDSYDDCGSSTTSWYYDNPDSPTHLTLCPDTCGEVQADSGARVWIEFGCPPEVVETTYTETYFGSCDTGQKPQWMFFYYDTTIESDGEAQVSFRVRTANSEGSLADENWQDAATATYDDPDCAKGSPVDGVCPVDLYATLGAVEAQRDYLELEITLTPSAGVVPTLDDWEITYSCQPAE